MLQRVIASLVMLFGILIFLLPKTDDKSSAMLASGAMLNCSTDYRQQVAQHLLRQEAVTVEFRNTCPDMIAAMEVSEQGEIVLTGSKHSLVLHLTPVIEDGKVLWSCLGEPAELVTKLCREIPIKAAETTSTNEENLMIEKVIITPQDE